MTIRSVLQGTSLLRGIALGVLGLVALGGNWARAEGVSWSIAA